jgi:hydroxymethylglutaryl-CoA reductase
MTIKTINGFSKLSKKEKIKWLTQTFLNGNAQAADLLSLYWHEDSKRQKRHDEFIENALSNFFLPFAIAPNFNIDGRIYAIPMVIEESSVVAAASNAAKFWLGRGGFKTEVVSTIKSGQIHLNYSGEAQTLFAFFETYKKQLISSVDELSQSMIKRGGGLIDLSLTNESESLSDYYYIDARFNTADAMGANYINSCLETIAETFGVLASNFGGFGQGEQPEVVMSILSNFVPECLVRVTVRCPVSELAQEGLSGKEFAHKFVRAVDIAQTNPLRAVTHNKGIMNGVDAVVLATGNDFRAVEAGIHAYACRQGQYKSLSKAKVDQDHFEFSIELPLALGTVGGLTKLHPMVGVALSILQEPSAEELMKIVATAGLAQNFAAIRSLVTTGIQKGHMKMHLLNLLSQYNAQESTKIAAIEHFKSNPISARSVAEFVASHQKNDD